MKQLVLIHADADAAMAGLLTTLGADFDACPLEEAIGAGRPVTRQDSALILSEIELISAYQSAHALQKPPGDLLSPYRNVLIYPFAATPDGLRALQHLVSARVGTVDVPAGSNYGVHGGRAMCGAFSGLHFGPVNPADRPLCVHESSHEPSVIVSAGTAALFTQFKLPQLDVWVTSSTAVFDVTAIHSRNLTAASCFSSLGPLLFFLRHCGIPLPQSTLQWANWIIDDPNLRPRYGFIDVRRLAESVVTAKAAVTIGFIPWNHKRTSGEVVDLFRAHWPRLSICVHGCDHTRAEFSTKTPEHAWRLAALAVSRMRHLQAKVSLRFDRVMVFPQGKFSAAAMQVLPQADFLAAVNTELVDTQSGAGVTGAELLQPAITSYSGFPLFMRRPAEEPIENFALDILLGKPCLVVTHHEYFHAGMQSMCSMVEALNRLDPGMTWTNLERGISHTASFRKNPDSTMNVRLFGARTELHLDLPAKRVFFTKLESGAAAPARVLWNEKHLPFSIDRNAVHFTGDGQEAQQVRIEITTSPAPPVTFASLGVKYRLKAALRRHLSEFRDNYIDRAPRVKAGIAAARQLASETN